MSACSWSTCPCGGNAAPATVAAGLLHEPSPERRGTPLALMSPYDLYALALSSPLTGSHKAHQGCVTHPTKTAKGGEEQIRSPPP